MPRLLIVAQSTKLGEGGIASLIVEIKKSLEASDIEIIILVYGTKPTLIKKFRILIKFFYLVNFFKINLVLYDQMAAFKLDVFRFRRIKTILLIHGWEVWKRFPAFTLKRIMKIDKILAVSDFTKNKFMLINNISDFNIKVISLFGQKEYLKSISNSSPDETYGNYQTVNEAIKKTVFLSLCRLDRYKNIHIFLMHLEKYIVDYDVKPDALKYIIAGDGAELTRLKEQVDRSFLLKQIVEFTGFVQNCQLSALYSSSDIFVHPSIGEGFGISPVTALQYGKISLVSDFDATSKLTCCKNCEDRLRVFDLYSRNNNAFFDKLTRDSAIKANECDRCFSLMDFRNAIHEEIRCLI